MRWSRALIPTTKETPSDAVIPSHQLMIRSGMIRPLGSGAYSYLPLGWRSLLKVIGIVREEMNAAGAQEVLMPALHPRQLWERTGRDKVLDKVLFAFKDRHGRDHVLGPTHEEVVTEMAAAYLRSYRQLPATLYQIQTKFRDEERPRFGVLRTREFIMMDAYSFDATGAGLDESYKACYDAYVRIMRRCGLNYVAVEADSGAMGGDVSHEFMVPTTSGEDHVARCASCGYAANVERCETKPPPGARESSGEIEPLTRVATPGATTIEQVTALLGRDASELAKTLIYSAGDRIVAVMIRGDHELNESKLASALKATDLRMADAETVVRVTGCKVGFAGPVGLKGVEIIADHALSGAANLVTGANAADAHYTGVNAGRDFSPGRWADLRKVVTGDPCPKCGEVISIIPCIEVGHVFKLGTKYSAAMGASFLDEAGVSHPCIMGCYGIGVNRVLVSAIEDLHDDSGILWPVAIAPYEALLVSVNPGDAKIREAADSLYERLRSEGVDVLYDDRDIRPGVKFKDADLIGVPLRVTVGERSLAAGGVELKWRAEKDARIAPLDSAPGEIARMLSLAKRATSGSAPREHRQGGTK